jgi:hypothetical protein
MSVEIVCGCQSTVHECATNCMACGRIYCVKELDLAADVSSMCSCGTLLVAPKSAEQVASEGQGGKDIKEMIDAYKQKDKLLQFDREYAKRTRVYDAQSDYYESGTWLSEEEKTELAKKETRRQERLREAGKVKGFGFSVDLAGRIRMHDVVDKGFTSSDTDSDGDGDGESMKIKPPPCASRLDEGERGTFSDSFSLDASATATGIGMTKKDSQKPGISKSNPMKNINSQLAERASKPGEMYRTLRDVMVDRETRALQARSERTVIK